MYAFLYTPFLMYLVYWLVGDMYMYIIAYHQAGRKGKSRKRGIHSSGKSL